MILDVVLEAILLSQQEWPKTSQIASTIAYSMAVFLVRFLKAILL